MRAVFAALNRDGHEARIVGGALRNTLMGLPVGDIDFATTALPDEIIRLAGEAGLKPIPTGIDHGTITVVSDHVPFEVTTLRLDVETHGRRATVAFTRDWREDAARRDFTINALYAGCDGTVFDPLGGLPDLKARHVRFIGSARERIAEDYLRIMRFFRFTAEYSSTPPDAEGLAACIRERAGLGRLSAERVRGELLRILMTRDPMRAIEPMSETGLLISLLGGIARVSHFERLADVEARLGIAGNAIRRLCALGVLSEDDAARLSTKLRLSNAESARLKAMAALRPVIGPEMSEKTARAVLYGLGADVWRDRVLIAWARSEATLRTDERAEDGWPELYALPQRWSTPVFPVKGQDLIACGMAPGARLGQTLEALEDRWIASDFTLSREELLSGLGPYAPS